MDASQPKPKPARAKTDADPRTTRGVTRFVDKATRSLSLRDMNGNPLPALRPPDQKKQAMFKAYLSKFPKGDMVQYLHRKYTQLEQQKWDFELEYRNDSWVFKIPSSESDFTLADSDEFKRWREEKARSAQAVAPTDSLEPQPTVFRSSTRHVSRSPDPPLYRE